MTEPVLEHDDVWPRIVRHRNLLEHRLSELQGLMQGRRIAHAPDAGLEHLAHWLEEEETLWETWPIPELRNLLRPCLHPSWRTRQTQLRPYIEAALAQYSQPLEAIARIWASRPEAPYDTVNADTLELLEKRLVFTGRFTGCSRMRAETRSEMLGALVRRDVAHNTDMLVVGARCHPGWIHSKRGRKIEKIIQWRAAGRSRCLIVREEDWADAVIAHAARLRDRGPSETGPA